MSASTTREIHHAFKSMGATKRGNVSLPTWMAGIVIATLVMPVLARVGY